MTIFKTAIQRTCLVTIAAITLGGSLLPTLQPAIATQTATATTTFSSYSQDSWRTQVHLARLSSNQLVMQVDIQDKPVTTYANAVYNLYAYHNNQWVQVYTNTGARLIRNQRARIVLAPEVVDCGKVSRESGIDIQAAELKAVVTLRYDNQSGRDQRVEFEQRRRFSEIAQATSTQIVRSVERETTTVSTNVQAQSSFSLAIAQASKKSKHVIARVSLKEGNQQGYVAERFLGDFRYKLHNKKQQANFIKGVKAGDRVVVRLFDKKGRFIGYSEFEVQTKNSLVTLIMGDQNESFGVVRTVQGIDADLDDRIDARSVTYDYFTQVTETQSWQSTQVAFFSSAQGISLSEFAIDGLPRPTSNCRLPNSFVRGQFSLVNQVFYAFGQNLAQAITSVPGQVVQVVDVSTVSTTTYEVTQLLTEYATVGVSRGVAYQTGERHKAKYKKQKHHKQGKWNCNQGRGNGSEGCDPGKSRPHGGSNDGDDDDDDDGDDDD
jgi:hypothetical protein